MPARKVIFILLPWLSAAILSGCANFAADLIKRNANHQTWVGHRSDLLEKTMGAPTKVEEFLEGEYKLYKYIGEIQLTEQKMFIENPFPVRGKPAPNYNVITMRGASHCASEFIINNDDIIVHWIRKRYGQCSYLPVASGSRRERFTENMTFARKLPDGKKYLPPSSIQKAFTNNTVTGFYNMSRRMFRRYYYEDGRLIEFTMENGVRKGRWRIKDDKVCERFDDEQAGVCLYLKKDWRLAGMSALLGYRIRKGLKSKYIEFGGFTESVPVLW